MPFLSQSTLNDILRQLPHVRIGVLGDGCVDIYWEADMTRSELSREVPHHPLPIVAERFSLGGGTNVVANLAALGVSHVRYLGVAGEDWRGGIFTGLLKKIGVSSDDLIFSSERVTPAYCKPIRCGISDVRYEDPRIDFGNHTPISSSTEEMLLEKLEQLSEACDVLLVCDQLDFGCMTRKVVDRINELGKRIPILVDSRNQGALYRNVILKPNEVETCRILEIDPDNAKSVDKMKEAARTLCARTGKPALVTLGERGALWCDGTECLEVDAYPVAPPIDFVGAGDSFLAGFAAAYAAKADVPQAISFANLVSSVTIRKIGMTGTATPGELTEALSHYLGQPE